MNRLFAFEVAICVGLGLLLTGCQRTVTAEEMSAAAAPPHATVEPGFDAANIQVDHPEQFPLATATEHMAAPELNVTGSVNPDVSRQVPVPSLATGRVMEIDARLGDEVRQGQLLFKVRSTDIAGAYADYRKAVMNEQLNKVQLNRAKILFDHGVTPKSALEVAQNAEDSALVDLETTREHLHLLGADPDHPSGIVEVSAPISGVITDQQITNQSGVQALSAPSPFTISDMSYVWVVCDVYENDLAGIHMGDSAKIRLNAYPGRVLKGSVSNISAILDPNLRTAKVRIEVPNEAMAMRIGMFATATFRGQREQVHTEVPAAAIIHLHDRDWVFVPAPDRKFRRMEVRSGTLLPGQMEEVLSGLKAGQLVVSNALVLENTVENQ
jgi:cobalt-zinc-cadmium efflux system membrane fusion protein